MRQNGTGFVALRVGCFAIMDNAMKMLWCWRCRREMSMFDEEEYTAAFRLYGDCMKGTKELRGSGMFRWKA